MSNGRRRALDFAGGGGVWERACAALRWTGVGGERSREWRCKGFQVPIGGRRERLGGRIDQSRVRPQAGGAGGRGRSLAGAGAWMGVDLSLVAGRTT